jgi:hypothetical protein
MTIVLTVRLDSIRNSICRIDSHCSKVIYVQKVLLSSNFDSKLHSVASEIIRASFFSPGRKKYPDLAKSPQGPGERVFLFLAVT